MVNENIDLVYILKQGDYNPELKYSLRSVCKYAKFRYIWCVGYTPTWLKGVRSVDVIQNRTKWENSTNNLFEACRQPDLSPRFILMNDDFFALHPITDWALSCNRHRGSMKDYLTRHPTRSDYNNSFKPTIQLLSTLGIEDPLCYELHIPTIIDKDNFIVMLRDERIKNFRSDHPVFLKRTVYHNLYPSHLSPRYLKDPKIGIDRDATPEHLRQEWLSVRDKVVDNPNKFPNIVNYLRQEFSEKCRYEK